MRTSRLGLGSGLRLLFHLHPKKPQPHSSSSSSYYSYYLFSPLSQPYSSSSSSIYSHLLPKQHDKQQQQQQPEKSSRSVGRPRLFRDYEPSLLSHKKSCRDFWSSSSRLESPPPLIPFVRNYSLRVAKIKKTEFDDTRGFSVRERNELLRFTSSPDNPLQSGMRKDSAFCSQDSV